MTDKYNFLRLWLTVFNVISAIFAYGILSFCSATAQSPSNNKVIANEDAFNALAKSIGILEIEGLSHEQQLEYLNLCIKYEIDMSALVKNGGDVYERTEIHQKSLGKLIGLDRYLKVKKQIENKSIGNQIAAELDKEGNSERVLQGGKKLKDIMELAVKMAFIDEYTHNKTNAVDTMVARINAINKPIEFLVSKEEWQEFKVRIDKAKQTQCERLKQHGSVINSVFSQ